MTDMQEILERLSTPDETLTTADLERILDSGLRRRTRRRAFTSLALAVVVVVAAIFAWDQFVRPTSTTRVEPATTNESELPAILNREPTAADTPPAAFLNTLPKDWFHLTNYRLLADDGTSRWYVARAGSASHPMVCLVALRTGLSASCTSIKAFARSGMLGRSFESLSGVTAVSFLVPDSAQVFADGQPVPTTNHLAAWYDNQGPLPRTVQFVTPTYESKVMKVRPAPKQP